MQQMLTFLAELRTQRISFDLKSAREEAVTVVIAAVDRYYEVEFFADGHTEFQQFGPPATEVEELSADCILHAIKTWLDRGEPAAPPFLASGDHDFF